MQPSADWTLAGLEQAFRTQDLPACHTDSERTLARAIHGKEIRARASEIASERALTAREVELATGYGWRP